MFFSFVLNSGPIIVKDAAIFSFRDLVFRLLFCVNLDGQILHLNVTPSWIDSKCLFKLPFSVKLDGQMSHLNIFLP